MCIHDDTENAAALANNKLYVLTAPLPFSFLRLVVCFEVTSVTMAASLSLASGLASLALFALSVSAPASASSVANNTYEYIVVGTGPGG
jgi:predicted naringenin-chalcone synthase